MQEGQAKPGGVDRTFSLLPYQLVPYSKYSIPFIIKCLKALYVEDTSIKKLLDYLAGFEEATYINLNPNIFQFFRHLVQKSIDKLEAYGFYTAHDDDKVVGFQNDSPRERMKSFLVYAEEFICRKVVPSIRGPCALGYDYYIQGGGYVKNAHFLFGTPYQFR